MVHPAQRGFLYDRVQEEMEVFNESNNPLHSMEPYPEDKQLSKEVFLRQCEWIYFNFFHAKKERPDETDELFLIWMYESMTQLFSRWEMWENFTLLHGISFGFNDEFIYPPTIKLGILKQSDIDWLMPRTCPSPESKRFFAHMIKYHRDRANFSHCFGHHFDKDSLFWIYSTRFPFWDKVPEFYSEKNGRNRTMRILDWDSTITRIFQTICCYGQLWMGTKVRVKSDFLVRLGLNDISLWSPRDWSMPKLGEAWIDMCMKNDLKL